MIILILTAEVEAYDVYFGAHEICSINERLFDKSQNAVGVYIQQEHLLKIVSVLE